VVYLLQSNEREVAKQPLTSDIAALRTLSIR
jgi:hypothetical protein